MKYRVLKNTMSTTKGDIIEVDDNKARQYMVNGVIEVYKEEKAPKKTKERKEKLTTKGK